MILAERFIARITRRPPDFVVGGAPAPHLRRWFVIPHNGIFNVYLHQFLRSDDNRALHDHPWANVSILLRGEYIEHTVDAGGVKRQSRFKTGDWRARFSGRIAHRIDLPHGPCWTLFITGPRYRTWGFHCPDAGWVPWQQFTAPNEPGSIGKGCEE